MKITLFLAALLLATVPPEPSALDVVVRSTEIDFNGHVNNAKHVEYLQWGRWDWLESRGFSHRQLADSGCALVVVHLDLNYRKEARQGDSLIVRTTPERIGTKSLTFRQEIRRGDEIVTDAAVTMVAIDAKSHNSVPVLDALARAFRDEIQAPEAKP